MAGEVETRKHTEMQVRLAQLGRQVGCDVWIPRNDRGGSALGKRLSDLAVENFPRLPFDEQSLKIIQNIDVVWIRGKNIEAGFEVESTTSIYSGLLRLSDLLASVPNLSLRMFILAESSRKDEVRRNIWRPTFVDQGLPDSVGFISFEKLAAEFGNLLQYAESSKAIDKISEELPAIEVPPPKTPPGQPHPGAGKTWADKLAWADPKVKDELLPELLATVRRSVAPALKTRTVGRWLYAEDGKRFFVLWVKKRGFIISVPSDSSFQDPDGLTHTVKGFFFPAGHERRFSLVLDGDVTVAVRLISEGHRIAKLPDFPWSRSRGKGPKNA